MTYLVPVMGGAQPESVRRKPGQETRLKLAERTFGEPRVEEFTLEPDGFSKEDWARWNSTITSYPNLATDGDVNESARKWVQQVLTKHRSKSTIVWQQWAEKERNLRVNSVSRMFPDSEMHVPEMWKAVETLVPRTIEPILEPDQWFQCVGRDQDDRRKAKAAQEWLEYQLELNKFYDHVEDFARTMWVYNFVAWKTSYECRYEKRIRRTVEEIPPTEKDKLPRIRVTETEVEEPVFEGCRAIEIDPYDFIPDPDHSRVEDMAYVGDMCLMGEDAIRRFAEDGTWDPGLVTQALQDSQEESAQGAQSRESYWKDIRSLQAGRDPNRQPADGSPRQFSVVELWATYQPKPGDEFDEYVITMVGNTIVRVQKNPHYDRHRPYCVARSSKDSTEFHGVGALDHAIRTQSVLDDNQWLMLQGHHLGQCPVVQVSHDSDAPESLFGIEPGSVLRGSSLNPVKIPDAVGPSLAIKEDLRREMGETTGALPMHENFGNSDTATESERLVKESNRRLRRSIYNFAGGLRQILEQWLELSRQNVRWRQMFRVMGRQANAISGLSEITLADLEVPHDIKIVGLRGLQQHGLRGTQMATFMSTFYPLMGQMVQEGRLNIGEFLSLAAESMLGEKLTKRILRPEQDPTEAMTADHENVVLMAGMNLDGTHESDVHSEHIPKHDLVIQWAERNDRPDIAEKARAHKAEHEAEDRARNAKLRKQFEQQMMAQPGLPGLHHTQEGRYDQGRGDMEADFAAQTPAGETPGPGLAHQNSAPDRTNGIPQTENRQ